MTRKAGIASHIESIALAQLSAFPDGLRYSELIRQIHAQDPSLKLNTISGTIWDLDRRQPDTVSKPERGLFKRVQSQVSDRAVPKGDEIAFYAPFADWLQNDVQEVTKAIALGGSAFHDKWGTPDVVGVRRSNLSDIVNMPMEIVSAEIKVDTKELITAFGQACAYRLFSHKVYIVIPQQSPKDERSRLDALCQNIGIGLVTFDVDSTNVPEFRIQARPAKHEPDWFYMNKYLQVIEKRLFG